MKNRSPVHNLQWRDWHGHSSANTNQALAARRSAGGRARVYIHGLSPALLRGRPGQSHHHVLLAISVNVGYTYDQAAAIHRDSKARVGVQAAASPLE